MFGLITYQRNWDEWEKEMLTELLRLSLSLSFHSSPLTLHVENSSHSLANYNSFHRCCCCCPLARFCFNIFIKGNCVTLSCLFFYTHCVCVVEQCSGYFLSGRGDFCLLAAHKIWSSNWDWWDELTLCSALTNFLFFSLEKHLWWWEYLSTVLMSLTFEVLFDCSGFSRS